MSHRLVVHKKRDDYDVYIGRGSKWGNPFVVGVDGTRLECIALYKDYLEKNHILLAEVDELEGKVLGCFCAPKACHGDYLARLANTNTVV